MTIAKNITYKTTFKGVYGFLDNKEFLKIAKKLYSKELKGMKSKTSFDVASMLINDGYMDEDIINNILEWDKENIWFISFQEDNEDGHFDLYLIEENK